MRDDVAEFLSVAKEWTLTLANPAQFYALDASAIKNAGQLSVGLVSRPTLALSPHETIIRTGDST